MPNIFMKFEYEDNKKTTTKPKSYDLDSVVFCTNGIINEVLEYDGLKSSLQNMKLRHFSTYRHSINVALFAIICGMELGLRQKELKDLAVAALLHDIGKMFIDASILDKPGTLTREERAIINRHPVLGYDLICEDTNISDEAKNGILFHHENEDGSGYPKGLKGIETPLIARIIHVADVYDALCSKRAYKDGFKEAESIEFLTAHCGTMFDIGVVKVFLQCLELHPVGYNVG